MRGPSRLVLVMGVIVFVDTMFYAVLAPLLPGLAHSLGLSKLSAGVLTASYPIGMLIGAIPGGYLVVRIGARATVATGLTLLIVSTVAFALLDSVAALDAARIVEGVGGACSWAGALAWIVLDTPRAQRGAMMGRAIGAAVGGALFGPVLGTIATATGRPAAFLGLAALSVGLIAWAMTLPESRAADETSDRGLLGVLSHREMLGAAWLVALPAIASGAVNVLGPLRLHRLGAGAAWIGAAFLCAAGFEAAFSPMIGALSDRRGRLAPLRFGLIAATVALLLFTVPDNYVLLGGVIVLIAVSLGFFWSPAMAMMSDTAQNLGLHQGLAAGLMNLAWAAGQIVGAGGGGAIAKTTGDAVPFSIVACLCALSLAGLGRWARSRAPEPAQHV